MKKFSAALVLFVCGHVVGEIKYNVTDLGGLGIGNNGSQAFGINNNGQICGDSEEHAFIWQNGVMQNVGTLGGNNSRLWGINDSGQVVGWALNTNGSQRAFSWKNGVAQDLGPGDARSINNLGQIVGTSGGRASVFLSGGVQDLGAGTAWGINNNGQIVGSGATLYSNGGIIGIVSGDAYGINDSGQVVGSSSNGNAFLWQNGIIHSLGFGVARGINASGQIVGDSSDIATLFFGNSSRQNLNGLIDPASGWFLKRAYSINDQGWIVGYGDLFGQERGFLLTPVSLPEPASLILFGFGSLMLVRRR